MYDMNTNGNKGAAMSWDDELPATASEKPQKILLDEGDYDFTVTNMERGYHSESDNLPDCPKATVTMIVDAGDGRKTMHTELFFLAEKTAWKNRAFFECLGLMEPGVDKRMPWDQIIDKRGRAHFKVKPAHGKHGDFLVNEISKFYAPEAHDAPETPKPVSFPKFAAGNRAY